MKIIKRFLSIALIVTLCFTVPFNTVSAKKSTAFKNKPIKEISGSKEEFSLNYTSEQAMLDDMTFVCENKNYALYYHAKSLAVGIKDKKSGAVFLTNPYNAANDSFYSGEVAEQLDSQLILTYLDSDGVINKFYSSTDSVKLGQYNVKLYDNGLRVEYSFGEEKEQLICPQVFMKADYEALTAKMDKYDKEKLEYYYSFVNLKKLSGDLAKEYTSKFPFAKGREIYVRTDVNSREEKAIDEIFRSVGYNEKRYNKDIKKYDIDVSDNRTANIKMALQYLLTTNGVKVTVPKDSIKFDSDICYLQSVDVLSYFGADSESTGDSGYLFIPDGSGAIINFANQSDTRRRLMTSRVYGYDKALNLENYKNDGKQYYLPVFGIVRNNSSALFAIIKDGDTLSEITARLGAPNSNYYSVYNTFLYTTVEDVERDTKVSSNRSRQHFYMHDDNVDKSDFVIDYTFLNGDNANYSGMAKVYREELKKSGMGKNKTSVSLGLETIGSALYEDSFLGFAYNKEAKLTKYKDNIKLLEYFSKQGINDISLTLNGWQKYGLDSSINKKIKFSSSLGNKSSFKQLVEECKKKNYEFYIADDISGVAYDRAFDGFSERKDTAKKIDRTYANLSLYDSATSRFEDIGYLTSPASYTKILNSFFKSAGKNDVKNINLKSLGTELNSDFSSDRPTNRNQTKSLLTRYFKSVKNDYNLSFEGVNAYVLPFATQLCSVPMTNSGYAGETASVPFVQLSVSGCVECFSEPVNLSGKDTQMLLSCIEYGISPSYILAYGNTELLKMTEYTKYYAISFDTLKKSVTDGYKYVKDALSKTDGTGIIKHSIIKTDVSLSEFENGTKIYVNSGKIDYYADGITIPAESYVVV